jgi:hypothetical protein
LVCLYVCKGLIGGGEIKWIERAHNHRAKTYHNNNTTKILKATLIH